MVKADLKITLKKNGGTVYDTIQLNGLQFPQECLKSPGSSIIAEYVTYSFIYSSTTTLDITVVTASCCSEIQEARSFLVCLGRADLTHPTSSCLC